MKVCIQAGHKGMTSGATGAPGERDWTSTIVPMVSKLLKNKSITVYETDAFANKDSKVTSTDWDLFLSVHYDADIYNDRGGFTDFPDPSVDAVSARSKEMSKKISDVFFPRLGIPLKNRSNANTRFYYMWQFLTAKTPCVIIECGVGWRKQEDYTTLRKFDDVAKALADGILNALGVSIDSNKPSKCEEELAYEKAEKEKYKTEARNLRKEVDDLNKKLEEKDKTITNLTKTIEKQNSEIVVLKKKLSDIERIIKS